MRAVRIGAPGRVEVVDAPRPDPGPEELLVRVTHAAVCATDRRLAARGSEPPRIPGHEVVGRAEDGTALGVHPDIGCGKCEECRSGFENRCAERTSIGLDRDGGLAEWVAVPPAHAVPLQGIDPAVGPLLEPLACCLHALDLLGLERGERALVVGAGSMGILSMWALQATGAVVAVAQRSPERRHLASRLGADAVLGPDRDPAEALGAPPVVAVVTAPGPEALAWALSMVAPGGRVHAFAGSPGGAPVDANVVHYRHLTLVGSTGSRVEDYVRARDLVASRRIRLDRMPRTTIRLDEVPEALLGERMRGELKVTVELEGGES